MVLPAQLSPLISLTVASIGTAAAADVGSTDDRTTVPAFVPVLMMSELLVAFDLAAVSYFADGLADAGLFVPRRSKCKRTHSGKSFSSASLSVLPTTESKGRRQWRPWITKNGEKPVVALMVALKDI